MHFYLERLLAGPDGDDDEDDEDEVAKSTFAFICGKIGGSNISCNETHGFRASKYREKRR